MNDDVSDWKWTEDAFQALAYWLGYQRKRFRHYPIREIAVVTELAALLHTSTQRRGWRIECETTFPKVLNLSNPDSISSDRQKRVDISIGPDKAAAIFAIEIKVPQKVTTSGTPAWAEDLHRLARLKQHNALLEVRLALVTESALPSTWFSAAGKAVRMEQSLSDGTKFKLRRIFRALPLLPFVDGETGRISMNKGPCVALLEPILSAGLPPINLAKRPSTK